MTAPTAHAGAVVDSSTVVEAVGQFNGYYRLPLSWEQGQPERGACRIELRGDVSAEAAGSALVEACLADRDAYTIETVGGITVVRPVVASLLDQQVHVEAQTLRTDALEALWS